MQYTNKLQNKRSLFSISPVRLIAFSFIVIIAVGTLLLTLPISSRTGQFTGFWDCLFTATSATCVTGLVVVDTYTHWSLFGQIVVLALIQLGGLSLVTFTTFITLSLRRRLGLKQLQISREYIGLDGFMNIPHLFRLIMGITVLCELIGALLLSFRFVPLYNIKGIWISIFLSISAYCNAGFDILGREGAFVSMTNYVNDAYVNLIIIALIVLGGLGFLVFNDIITYKKSKRLMMHTKIVLWVTAILIIFGTALFMISEYSNPDTIANMSFGNKLIASLFQSVTTRTAGFNTVDLGACNDFTKILMCFLMFIGASSGSTGGGIKTTTFAVLIITVISICRGREDAVIMHRKIDKSVVYKAFVITMLSLLVVVITFSVIYVWGVSHDINTFDALFEAVSAFSTSGLTCGITTSLGLVPKIFLIATMFIGRVGPVSAAFMLTKSAGNNSNQVLPECKIMVG